MIVRWRSCLAEQCADYRRTLDELHKADKGSKPYFAQEAHPASPAALRWRMTGSGAEKLLKKYGLKRPLDWFYRWRRYAFSQCLGTERDLVACCGALSTSTRRMACTPLQWR